MAALLVLGGATACPTPEPCFSGPQGQPPTQERVFGMDQEVVLDVRATLTHACDPTTVEARRPESVTVEVYDPENQPVPATAELSLAGATVRFTPTMRGRHHVLVAFAPVGSLHQLDVLVVEDHREAPRLAFFPSVTTCPYVDRTTQGTWLCGAKALREPREPLQQLATSSHPTVAVAGDVVWVLDGNEVRRYVDRGSGPLAPTGTATLPLNAGTPRTPGPDSRGATPEELLLVRNGSLYRYTFSESGGVASAPTTVLSFIDASSSMMGNDSTSALLLRTGARLLVVGSARDPRTFESRTVVCPYELDTLGAYAPVLDIPCQAPEGNVVGYEADVLWTTTTEFSAGQSKVTLHRYPAASGRLVAEGTLALNGGITAYPSSLRPGPILPILRSTGSYVPAVMARWNATTGLVDLEVAPGAGSTSDVSYFGERFIWVEHQGGTGGVTVYARPSTR
ncbi:hypothetical protein HPC49_44150 [Pyxidicoccus fallax]|uniref:Uncharacterized protein n=1 Tax=Pyxidicoccus fallax TaxID=394095 RepID=A0A848L9R0_9BACT|nr:hypothetical protein [Pyxidicoccus fallax]NMO15589.1 hypothetical protein [Pyxidicoccus fallax]NPC85176.1 hypothetical protein [Pyxidicoccus fallax]